MKQPLTVSAQDYLKQIYELTAAGENASTNALSARLKVKPASVTNMMQKLASSKPALVVYHKHQGVTLTDAGSRAALEVIRHHRLLETWLVQTLGYSWEEVHEEAERMEHVISEKFEKRISEAMGNPQHDPHGEPIPTAKLEMPASETIPLSALHYKRKSKIQSIHNADKDLLRYLSDRGLVPGAEIEILGYSTRNKTMTVRVSSRTSNLSQEMTQKIFLSIESLAIGS